MDARSHTGRWGEFMSGSGERAEAVRELVQRLRQPLAPEVRSQRIDAVLRSWLAQSRHLERPQFELVYDADLCPLFSAYDREFFGGALHGALGGSPLQFRFSQRMTSAGGKTTRVRHRAANRVDEFEIAVSISLLYLSFDDDRGPLLVTGLPCHTRRDALLRIFEHELIHLSEMLVWDGSNCQQRRFQAIADGLFGHRASCHQLLTHRDVARDQHGIRTGSRVQFSFEGRRLTGIVNRVTKRATVLVEDPRGQPYSDGKRYAKYYIPFDLLEPAA